MSVHQLYKSRNNKNIYSHQRHLLCGCPRKLRQAFSQTRFLVGDSGNVFANFYFAGLNPLDRESVEDADTPDLPVKVADIQDMLKAYKNIDENKIVHNSQRRDLKYGKFRLNFVIHAIFF